MIKLYFSACQRRLLSPSWMLLLCRSINGQTAYQVWELRLKDTLCEVLNTCSILVLLFLILRSSANHHSSIHAETRVFCSHDYCIRVEITSSVIETIFIQALYPGECTHWISSRWWCITNIPTFWQTQAAWGLTTCRFVHAIHKTVLLLRICRILVKHALSTPVCL